jgi:hypothetical protein
MRPDVPTHPYGRRRPPVPDQSAVEGFLETQRRGYQTKLVPPELRLAQQGWTVRQEWIAEKDRQTIRGPALENVAEEASPPNFELTASPISSRSLPLVARATT